MIIGIDASRANNGQRTGVEEYAFRLILEFIVHSSKFIGDRQVEFVLYSDRPLQGELAKFSENWTQKVLKWPPFGSSQGKPWRLWTQIRLSWEMLVKPPDVLFIPAHVMPLIHPKKTVVMIHDVAALKFPESYNWFERWYSVWSAQYALRKAWKVIVPSEFVKKELQNADLGMQNCDKIFVVHHGFNQTYRKIDDKKNIEVILKKYSMQKPFIMSIGRLEEKKNTVRIIKAFEQVKNNLQSPINNLQLLLVGKPGYGYEGVEQAINNSPYKNDIITPGFVSEEDMPYLMNAAEVFVFPSLYEGFGLPVLEAMACGTPVVASGRDASAKFSTASQEIGGDACVYVDPMSVEDIARGIEDVMSDGGRGTRNVEKGLERVKSFSWKKCGEETLDILLN